MMFALADGTKAHLWGIVQNGSYGRPYLEPPKDAVGEMLRLATLHLSPKCWAPAPMLFIGMEPERVDDLLRRRKLPLVMCIGQFDSMRRVPDERLPRRAFLTVVWLQEDFLPYFSPENEAAFARIEFDKYIHRRKDS